ncbi:MFS transporter [Francisella philomiragia]|uniref:AmpG family muropeptide MFS transporter n=1 Tax=Francisella philomiragia TaxID=28110 RepID=UPI0019060A0D|nr:MFS transporter [Francisella philomiragia]MBK2025557.1 MFS transporter [Francisella philomiragia]
MNDSEKLTLKQKFKAIFQQQKMFIMFVLGYSSGLPLMLTGASLLVWYHDTGIDIKTIGLLTLVAIPYTIKYLWAPFIDKITIKGFSRRKGWILLTQICLIFLVASMSLFSPDKDPVIIAIIALLISFTSATQDISINAYQTEILEEREKALGNAISVMGYRIGMLVTSALILLFADYTNWHTAFLLTALFFMIAPVITLFIKENDNITPPQSYKDAFLKPFVEFFTRKSLTTALIILAILIVYKLADAIALSLNSVFFLDLGFSKTAIASVYKTTSLLASMLGLLTGGSIAYKIGIFRSFLLFSFVMAFANLTYAVLATVGHNYPLMISSVFVDSFCGAMGTAILVAMIMSLVNKSFSATQFAILSSIDSLARVFVGPLAGHIQYNFGWATLFVFSFVVGICVSIVIFIFRNRVKEMANLN